MAKIRNLLRWPQTIPNLSVIPALSEVSFTNRDLRRADCAPTIKTMVACGEIEVEYDPDPDPHTGPRADAPPLTFAVSAPAASSEDPPTAEKSGKK